MDVEGGAFDAEKEAQPVTYGLPIRIGGLHFPEPWITVYFIYSITLLPLSYPHFIAFQCVRAVAQFWAILWSSSRASWMRKGKDRP